MKKRLLITSIVMMLVVAVALSTATYAWFTSNDNVTASTMSLRASVSDGSSLGIAWLGGEPNTFISSNVSDVLGPMAPAALVTGSTPSNVLFYTSTTKEEGGQVQFNGGSASYTEFATTAGVTNVDGKYEIVDGVYVAASGTAVAEHTYYTKGFAPVVYNNGSGVQAFYVQNLSKSNTVPSVTVTLDNVPANGEFIPAVETTMIAGVEYSTFAEAFVEVGTTDVSAKYILTNGRYALATGKAVAGTTYYDKTTVKAVASNAGANEIVVTATDGYYVEVKAADMIRVAIFAKANANEGSVTEGDYKLVGVLGTAATTFTSTGALTAQQIDKNTTYYTSEAVSSQIAPTEAGTYYTAANTAVYGNGSSDDAAVNKFNTGDAVKDLDHYAVSTSLTITSGALAARQHVDLVAIAWLDGTELVDARAGQFGQISLKFTAA